MQPVRVICVALQQRGAPQPSPQQTPAGPAGPAAGTSAKARNWKAKEGLQAETAAGRAGVIGLVAGGRAVDATATA
jgi:hypothetical protein